MRFGADFGPKFSKKFCGRKILRSKSREIAPKSMPPGGAQLHHDLKMSLTSVQSVSMLCRVRLRAISSGFELWTETFENYFRGRKILRSKSREIAPKSMPPGGAQLPHDL